MHSVSSFRGRIPQCHCQCFRCRLDSLLGRTNLRFKLCWLWGPPLIRTGDPLPSLLPWIWRTTRCWKRAYRVVRFDSRRTADSRSRMGIQPLAYSFITHGSWSSSVRRGRLASYTTPQRSGWINSERNKRWPLPSTCNVPDQKCGYIMLLRNNVFTCI